MKYFACLLPMIDPEKSQEIRPQHVEYLKKMRAEGKLFAFGRFLDGTSGLIIYMAETIEEAVSYVKNDPFVINHARGYEVHEWAMETDAVLK